MPRLSKIYTRTGDAGTTGLADGQRLAKDHPRIQAFGDIDELNSLLGVIRAVCGATDALEPYFSALQHRLFDIGGELAMPDYQVATAAWVTLLEQWLDRLNAELPNLQEFILPAGTLATAHCHQARAVCRRAERTLWTLAQTETVNPHSLCYLNRLSDLLFVMARTLARREGAQEVTWQPDTDRTPTPKPETVFNEQSD